MSCPRTQRNDPVEAQTRDISISSRTLTTEPLGYSNIAILLDYKKDQFITLSINVGSGEPVQIRRLI